MANSGIKNQRKTKFTIDLVGKLINFHLKKTKNSKMVFQSRNLKNYSDLLIPIIPPRIAVIKIIK